MKALNCLLVLLVFTALLIGGCSDNSLSPAESLESSQAGKNQSMNKDPMRGSALFFDGIDDYVMVSDHPSLDITNGFTIAAWIKLETYTEWASIVTKGGSPNHNEYINNFTIHQSGPDGGTDFGHLRFTFDGATTPLPESNTIIPLNEWHFITVTFDGTTLTFFLNGEPDGQYEISGLLVPNNDPLNIGADFPGVEEYWQGFIDELRIWNKPLKQVHVQAAMHGHSSPMASALVGDWTFDEGSGDVAYDRSRFRNDGTLSGNPKWVSPGAPIH